MQVELFNIAKEILNEYNYEFLKSEVDINEEQYTDFQFDIETMAEKYYKLYVKRDDSETLRSIVHDLIFNRTIELYKEEAKRYIKSQLSYYYFFNGH